MHSGGVPKYVISNLKINNFKGNKSTRKVNGIFLFKINVDEHVSMKINTFGIYKGGQRARLPEAEENF